MKNKIIGLLIATTLFSTGQGFIQQGISESKAYATSSEQVASLSSESPFDIIVNNTKLDFNEKIDGVPVGTPYIENGRTFVPLRFLASYLGYEIEWIEPCEDFQQGTVFLRRYEDGIPYECTIIIGENYCIWWDGTVIHFDDNNKDIRSNVRDGRTYVPLRFFSELAFTPISYLRPSEEYPQLERPTVYVNSDTPTPQPQVHQPFAPVDFSTAKLKRKEHNSMEVYQFNHTLESGATIHEVIFYENEILIRGHFNGVYYLATYSCNRSALGFPFAHESIFSLSEEIRFVIEALKPYHWNPALHN